MKKQIKWISDDGEEFESEEACKQWDRMLALKQALIDANYANSYPIQHFEGFINLLNSQKDEILKFYDVRLPFLNIPKNIKIKHELNSKDFSPK